MKRIVCLFIMFVCIPVMAVAKDYYVEMPTATSSYEQKIDAGVTNYERKDTIKYFSPMSFSGTSICPVVDTSKLEMDGYYTFQFKWLTGVTTFPVTGTTISVHWRGSEVDTESAWITATKNTIINGINARTGATAVGYDINSITGVTPFRFFRLEYESGISGTVSGNGNLIPLGVLHIK